MNRRGRALAIVVLAVLLVAPPSNVLAGSGPSDDDATRPVPTVSDFYPENANLSDCVGFVERPGCGSESRGGWRQLAVFAALAAGLGLIAWRATAAIRKNRTA